MRRALLVAVSLVVVACSTEPVAIDAQRTATAFRTACLELNNRVKDRAEACKVPPWLDGPSSINNYCSALAGVVESNSVVYDESNLEACRAAVDGASCCDVAMRFQHDEAGYTVPLDVLRVAPACRSLLHGTKKQGAPCHTLAECGDGLFCFGTCEAPLPEGAECGGEDLCRRSRLPCRSTTRFGQPRRVGLEVQPVDLG